MTNARAEALLDKQGIRYKREPSWIEKGQKPDFYCHGVAALHFQSPAQLRAATPLVEIPDSNRVPNQRFGALSA